MSTSPARADDATPVSPANTAIDKAECALTFERAQRLRNASTYLLASAEALRCANPACGQLLSEECGKIYSELESAIPTVVFAARDASGKEIPNVTVRIDQAPTGVLLDGKPIAIDPGQHQFTFSAAGFEPLAQSAVIRTAERYRPVTATLHRLKESSPARPSSGERPTPAPARGVPLASYVLGGIAVAGVGAFAGFRISGGNDFDALSRECKPMCTEAQVDGVRNKYLLSHVSLAVGGAAAVAAITIYLTASKGSAPATALQIKQTRTGISTLLTTRF